MREREKPINQQLAFGAGDDVMPRFVGAEKIMLINNIDEE